jgi:GMP synthase PP-ATPase subunit
MISVPVVRSAQTIQVSCVKNSSISNELTQASTWASSPRSTIGCVQNDFRAYGMFSTIRAPILHRHQHYLQMDQNEILHNPCHLGVPSGASKAISKNLVRSSQTMHLSCIKISTISNELNQASTWALSPRSTDEDINTDHTSTPRNLEYH